MTTKQSSSSVRTRSKSATPSRVSKAQATRKKIPVSKTKQPASVKVDYYPNRMTVAVSVLAGTILVFVSVVAVINSR